MSILKDYWVLTDVRGPMPSKKTIGKFYVVEMKNAGTGEVANTYADTCHGNFKYWEPLIEKNWGFYGNIKMKRAGLINGDYRPLFAETLPEDECKSFKETGKI